MEVNDAATAHELVHEWIKHREGERARLNLPLRPLPDLADRFGRWSNDQRRCAALARLRGNTMIAAAHEEAAGVLFDAASEVSRAE